MTDEARPPSFPAAVPIDSDLNQWGTGLPPAHRAGHVRQPSPDGHDHLAPGLRLAVGRREGDGRRPGEAADAHGGLVGTGRGAGRAYPEALGPEVLDPDGP